MCGATRARLLLCTDLDGTLLPNGRAHHSSRAHRWYRALAADPAVTVAFVTGRAIGLVDAALAEHRLPAPRFVVADVGSSLYERCAGAWRRCPQWERVCAALWAGCAREDVAAALEGLGGLVLQEHSHQGLFKVSYYATLRDCGAKDIVLADVERRLAAINVRASLVWSDGDKGVTALLDVLPEGANKIGALRFLREKLAFSVSECFFAGDSGNDMDVLVSEIPAAVVCNAYADVKVAAQNGAYRAGNSHALYLAFGGFGGMNGNYAAGIMEGVQHFHPQVAERVINAVGSDIPR